MVLHKAAFGFSQDDQSGMRFRQMFSDGMDRSGYAALDSHGLGRYSIRPRTCSSSHTY